MRKQQEEIGFLCKTMFSFWAHKLMHYDCIWQLATLKKAKIIISFLRTSFYCSSLLQSLGLYGNWAADNFLELKKSSRACEKITKKIAIMVRACMKNRLAAKYSLEHYSPCSLLCALLGVQKIMTPTHYIYCTKSAHGICLVCKQEAPIVSYFFITTSLLVLRVGFQEAWHLCLSFLLISDFKGKEAGFLFFWLSSKAMIWDRYEAETCCGWVGACWWGL